MAYSRMAQLIAASALAAFSSQISRPRLPPRVNTQCCRRWEFITALHVYGAIVVDRSSVPTLYAKFNGPWGQRLRDANGRLLDSNGNVEYPKLPGGDPIVIVGNGEPEHEAVDAERGEARPRCAVDRQPPLVEVGEHGDDEAVGITPGP